jgi:hypothetical protein
MKKIFKNVVLINDDLQLIMKDESGETITSILHFGVYNDKLDEFVFKGKKTLRVKEIDFESVCRKLLLTLRRRKPLIFI